MPEETPTQKDNLADFIETISRADGELIPLPARRSKLGEPYFLSVRYGQDEVETDYRYLIVDVLVQRGDRFVPVGIYDWEITGETALGNKQRHGHLPALNPAQEAADRYWSTGRLPRY